MDIIIKFQVYYLTKDPINALHSDISNRQELIHDTLMYIVMHRVIKLPAIFSLARTT